jgi:hypothetical protein
VSRPDPTGRRPPAAVVHAVTGCLAVLVAAQLLLLIVGIEGASGHRPELPPPCAVGSAACFGTAWWLSRSLRGGR